MSADPSLEQERNARFEGDKAAYGRLPPVQRVWADRLANFGFGGRSWISKAGRVGLGAFELVFNIFLRLPYVFIGRVIAEAARAGIEAVKSFVTMTDYAARGGLAAAKWLLTLANKTIDFFNRKKPDDKKKFEASHQKIDQGLIRVGERRDTVMKWAADTKAHIDQWWDRTKEKLGNGWRMAIMHAEYYGALGLYRGTRWILNPRRKDGSPLLGSERMNKIVGFSAALAGFVVLAAGLTAVGAMAKVWHAELAHSLFTDTAPLAMKIMTQLVVHPAITIGLTAAKFVTLPIIAATRDILKATDFVRGMAFRYNQNIRDELAAGPQPVLFEDGIAREVSNQVDKLSEAIAQNPDGTNAVPFNKKNGPKRLVEKFVEHVIEKADPAFYDARIAYYQRFPTMHDAFNDQAKAKAHAAAAHDSNGPSGPAAGPS